MKKFTLLLFTLLFTLTACSTSPSEEVEVEEPKTFNQIEAVDPQDVISATGQLDYFVTQAPTPYANSALNRLCMTPAQLDTTNDGDLFCFKNAGDALRDFDFSEEEGCAKYTAVATVELGNLSTDVPSGTRADECFDQGSCPFNEAVFMSVEEVVSGFECKN